MNNMTTISMTGRTLRHAAERAALAPSVHNTQPWQFAVNESTLQVLAVRARQLTVLDPKARQLYVSLGCALLNARASLAAAGVGATVTREPDQDRPDLAVRVDLVDDAAIDHELAALDAVIDLRRSNRRQFAPDPVPPELIERLVAAATTEGALLHPVTDPDDRLTLARLSQAADRELITNAAYRAEIRAWTGGDASRTDGVPAAAVPHVDGSAHDDVPMRDFDMSGAAQLPAETQSSLNQCLLVLGTTVDSPSAWLCAGEALERVWLEVTRAGFVASLFTQVTEIPALRAELRTELRLNTWPHVVLRIGRAPATPATPRRPIDEVLTDTSGT
jgi:hypothetical protein